MDAQNATDALKQILRDYAFDREKGINRGAETSEFAALLVQNYGYALADAAKVLYSNIVSAEVYVETGRLATEIDPGWKDNNRKHRSFRPATVAEGTHNSLLNTNSLQELVL